VVLLPPSRHRTPKKETKKTSPPCNVPRTRLRRPLGTLTRSNLPFPIRISQLASVSNSLGLWHHRRRGTNEGELPNSRAKSQVMVQILRMMMNNLNKRNNKRNINLQIPRSVSVERLTSPRTVIISIHPRHRRDEHRSSRSSPKSYPPLQGNKKIRTQIEKNFQKLGISLPNFWATDSTKDQCA